MQFWQWFDSQNIKTKFLLIGLLVISFLSLSAFFAVTSLSLNLFLSNSVKRTRTAGVKVKPVLSVSAKEGKDKQILVEGGCCRPLENEVEIDLYDSDGNYVQTTRVTFSGKHFSATFSPFDFEQSMANSSYYVLASTVLKNKEHSCRSKDFSFSGMTLTDIHYSKGIENLNKKDYRGAVSEFRSTLSLNSDHTQAKSKLNQVNAFLEKQQSAQ